jgi:hypothetical protein
MTATSTTYVRGCCRRIAILHDKLCLTVRVRVRPSEIDDVRSRPTAPAAIGRQQERDCSKERAP